MLVKGRAECLHRFAAQSVQLQPNADLPDLAPNLAVLLPEKVDLARVSVLQGRKHEHLFDVEVAKEDILDRFPQALARFAIA